MAAQARHPTSDAEAAALPRGSETIHGQPPHSISASSLLPHLAMLLAFQIGSGILVRELRIPVPGPLVGMLALLAFLAVRKSDSAGLRQLSKTVIDHMNLFFVPAGASIVTATALTGIDALAIASAVAVSTLVSIAVAAALETLASKCRARPMAPEMPAVGASGFVSKGNENERRIERCQRERM